MYRINKSGLEEYSSKSESLDAVLKPNGDATIKLLDKTYIKTDFIR